MSLHELLRPLVTEYGVTKSEVAALTAAARTTLYLRGGELPAQLRAAPYTLVIERGSLRVGQVSSQGRQAITDIWQAGCRFWQFSPDPTPIPTTMIAARVNGTIVHLLPTEQVLALAARHPALARALAASAAAEAASSVWPGPSSTHWRRDLGGRSYGWPPHNCQSRAPPTRNWQHLAPDAIASASPWPALWARGWWTYPTSDGRSICAMNRASPRLRRTCASCQRSSHKIHR